MGQKVSLKLAKPKKIDPGSFSRTVSRWVDAGIVFRIPEGRDVKLLHVYPLPPESSAKERAR